MCYGSESDGSLEVPELVFEPMFALIGDLGAAVKGSGGISTKYFQLLANAKIALSRAAFVWS